MNRAASVVLLAIGASACTPPASSSPVATPAGPSASVVETETGGSVRLTEQFSDVTVNVAASADSVWSRLPGIYTKLGITTEVNDPEQRVIGTRGFTQSRLDGRRTADYVRCANEGAGPSSGGMYRMRLSILTSVKRVDDAHASLTTQIEGSASAVEGTSTGEIACVSNGLLERRIRSLLLDQLGGQ